MRPFFVMLCLAAVLGSGAYLFLRYAPDRYDPFAPLDISAPPSFLTAWKLRRLKDDPQACFAALGTAGLNVQPVPDRETGQGCGFENVVRLKRSPMDWGAAGLPLTCPMAAALAVWERHDLQPAAEAMLAGRVARITHFGSYACRNVNNAVSGRRSQHARANAVDIAGFVLEDGREISVLKDWGGEDARARFLERAHAGACRRFASALGPDYNAAHANHFHLDMGGFGICR